MDTLRASVQDWVMLRTPRERLLLGVALAFAVTWLGIAAIWQPLRHYRANLEVTITRYESGLVALQNPLFSTQGPQTPTADSPPVPVILTDTADIFQLVIRRLEAEGTGARVVLEEATFEQVIFWLEALERDHGLRVSDLEMTRRPAPGIVSVNLALER